MFKTLEEEKQYCRGGNLLLRDFRKQIGRLLAAERLNRHQTLEEAERCYGMPSYRIEMVEMARRKFNWNSLSWLLEHYGKQLDIRLVDAEPRMEK